jgi:methylamine dehydrogenase accessory protein MauD
MEGIFVTDPIVAGLMLLWLVVLVLCVAVLALARQIGILHTRLAPAGALMTSAGPKVGEPAPTFTVEDIAGRPLEIGGARDAAQLILFVSPTCPVCKSVVPAARALARSERRRLRLMFASDGGELDAHRRYIDDMDMAAHPYVVSLALGMKFQVGKLPYAVLIGRDGTLHSKGLVNSREHLESLVESMDSGFHSIQDYLFHEPLENQAR